MSFRTIIEKNNTLTEGFTIRDIMDKLNKKTKFKDEFRFRDNYSILVYTKKINDDYSKLGNDVVNDSTVKKLFNIEWDSHETPGADGEDFGDIILTIKDKSKIELPLEDELQNLDKSTLVYIKKMLLSPKKYINALNNFISKK